MSRFTNCVDCGIDFGETGDPRVHAAHGRCFTCLQRMRRAAESIGMAPGQRAGMAERIKVYQKLGKIIELVDGLDCFRPDESRTIKAIAVRHIDVIVGLMRPVNSDPPVNNDGGGQPPASSLTPEGDVNNDEEEDDSKRQPGDEVYVNNGSAVNDNKDGSEAEEPPAHEELDRPANEEDSVQRDDEAF
jgi:hypothetical protein